MEFKVEKTLDGLGRVVLPKAMRDYYGLTSGDKVTLIPTKEGILIMKAGSASNDTPEKEG